MKGVDLGSILNCQERQRKAEQSFISKLFYGIKEEKVRCTRCGKGREKEVAFNSLMVDIRNTREKISIEEYIKNIEREEKVKLECEYCKQGKKAIMTVSIKRYPKCLIVMLKRFIFGEREKNRKLVHFPIQTRNMNLKAVIEHHGKSMESGHYVAKCWNQVMQKWYLIDDLMAKEIDHKRLHTEEA